MDKYLKKGVRILEIPNFTIKRESIHFRVASTLTKIDDKISICEYGWNLFWAIVLFIPLELNWILISNLLCTVLLIAYPKKPRMWYWQVDEDYHSSFPKIAGVIPSCFFTITAISVSCIASFITKWPTQFIWEAKGIMGFMVGVTAISTIASLLILTVEIIPCAYKRSLTVARIKWYFEDMKAAFCPMITVEPKTETKSKISATS